MGFSLSSLEALNIDEGSQLVHDLHQALLVLHYLIQVLVGLRRFISQLWICIAHYAWHGALEIFL